MAGLGCGLRGDASAHILVRRDTVAKIAAKRAREIGGQSLATNDQAIVASQNLPTSQVKPHNVRKTDV